MRLLGYKADKFKDRRLGDSKKRLYTRDLLELYGKLDNEKADLPLFVPTVFVKVPGDTPAECDVSVFAASLTDLIFQVTEIQHAVTA